MRKENKMMSDGIMNIEDSDNETVLGESDTA
jgi:hypothetical protein